MSNEYIRDLLRVAVAQICQTIGYNSAQATALELLQDILHKFLHEFSRDLRRQVEHYNRVEANLDDTYLTLRSLNVNINELLDYINNVEPVPYTVDVPKFPVHKDSNLNFLKPGSKEVLVRPVHIYQHLPPMLHSDQIVSSQFYNLQSNHQKSAFGFNVFTDALVANSIFDDDAFNSEQNMFQKVEQLTQDRSLAASTTGKRVNDKDVTSSFIKGPSTSSQHLLDDEGRPTREISSVVMTTGGFISPAIEGKLPDAIIPSIIEKLQGLDALPLPQVRPPLTHLGENQSTTAPIIKINSKKDVEPSPVPQIQSEENISKSHDLKDSNQHVNIISTNSEDTDTMSTLPNANVENIKKHISYLQMNMHMAPTPTMALKLLKKAKKKSSNWANQSWDRLNQHHNVADNILGMKVEDTKFRDKSQKKMSKCHRRLQKLSKSKKYPKIADVMNYFNSDNPDLPSSADCLQMEKWLKKQTKQKHKAIIDKTKDLVSEKNVPEEMLLLNSENVSNSSGSFVSQKTMFCNTLSKDTKTQQSIKETILTTSLISVSQNSNAKLVSVIPSYNSDDIKLDSTKTAINSSDKKTLLEIKLSNEPDKSKLNIFKKISKQKFPKSASPSRLTSTSIYTANDNQVFSLPSGTTITPALVSTPEVRSSHNSIDEQIGNQIMNTSENLLVRTGVMPSEVSVLGPLGEEGLNLINKPKKRGRKPGSKNHVKASILLSSPDDMAKKAKKVKTEKNTFSPFFPMQSKLPSEPLNLTSPSRVVNMNAHMGYSPVLRDQMLMQLTPPKERKERKKSKVKSSPIATVTSEHDISKTNQNSFTSRDEFNTIFTKNPTDDFKKSALHQMPQDLTDLPKAITVTMSPKEDIPSTTKSTGSNKSPIAKKKLQQERVSGGMLIPSMPFSPSFMKTDGLAQQNMPDLVKLYPISQFPPRPGLIPTAPNMLLPGLLPFQNFRPVISTGKTSIPDIENEKERPKDSAMPTSAERNYCNVAPFVPESMKLTSLETKSAELTENEYLHPPMMHQSPTSSDIFTKNKDIPNILELNSANKNISSVSGLHFLGNFEPRLRGQTDKKFMNINPTQISDNTNPNTNLLHKALPSAVSMKMGSFDSSFINPPKTINLDDPIEVSDDSTDSPLKPQTVRSTHSLVKPFSSPFISPSASNPDETELNKEGKKYKKCNKYCKNTFFSAAIPTSNIGIFSPEKGGVGKLAGGADLIPLITTGLAYSAATIPSTSLTVASATPACPFRNIFDNLNMPFPNDQQKKRKEHKKLKKLKEGKIKKKKDKKEKSKNKERDEKNVFKLENMFKGKDIEHVKDKELLKKLKKERKKEKQRTMMAASLIAPPPVQVNPTNIIKSNLSQPFFEKGHEKLPPNSATSSVIPSTVSSLPISSAPVKTSVPKLTLKLGTPQLPTQSDDVLQTHQTPVTPNVVSDRKKRDPSPELARISPLITRPIKNKSSNESSNLLMNSLSATSAAATSTSTLDSFANDNKTSTSNIAKPISHSLIPPPSPWLAGSTISASSVLLPQQLLQTTQKAHENKSPTYHLPENTSGSAPTRSIVADRQSPVPLISETSRPSSYIDAEGNRVWICPACGKVDDGSPMIGCDGCDAWYHWICVGISVAPKDNEDWFCRVCITRKKGMHSGEKKRKRNKKK